MTQTVKPLAQSKLHGPATEFLDYCEAEFERRRNSDEAFDEESWREAMQLALRKLPGAFGGEVS